MLESDAVRKIGFTGSTAVGKQLMAGAAATVKRVSLELARLPSQAAAVHCEPALNGVIAGLERCCSTTA